VTVDELVEAREHVQRGLGRHAVAEADHPRAQLGEPQRQPRALEAGVAGDEHPPARPEGGVGQDRSRGVHRRHLRGPADASCPRQSLDL
jgi:hypothetical protein